MDEDSHGHCNIGKHRSSQPLIGTMVVPSDEDSQTFSVVFASGKEIEKGLEVALNDQQLPQVFSSTCFLIFIAFFSWLALPHPQIP